MSIIVITLTNAPPSLRGDLTKWLQEISTGVYVGKVNARIREQLWDRVTQTVGKGQASLTYSTNNELGYDFRTFNCLTQKILLDGIPLVMQPINLKNSENFKLEKGFSKASHFRKASKYNKNSSDFKQYSYIILDIETTSLNTQTCDMIEIGAVKVSNGAFETFDFLVSGTIVTDEITELTGINQKMIEDKGVDLKIILEKLIAFINELPIVGYNLRFDLDVINRLLFEQGFKTIANKTYDLLKFVKKEKIFLKSYSLQEVLNAYEIDRVVDHRALSDAYITYELSTKVNLFSKKLKQESHS